MLDAIKQILEAGGTVTFPDRKDREAMDRPYNVYQTRDPDAKTQTPHYCVGNEYFDSAADAATEFASRVITKENVGLAMAYWYARGIDLEDADPQYADSLIKSFMEDLFDRLYPFVKKE